MKPQQAIAVNQGHARVFVDDISIIPECYISHFMDDTHSVQYVLTALALSVDLYTSIYIYISNIHFFFLPY